MAHNEQRAGSDGCYLGIDWNSTSSATQLKIAPTVWRWDAQNTDNYSGRFSESLSPDPSGAGYWSGYSWGSGSGWRKVDTFATRTYTRTHSSQTITLKVSTDSSFGTYYGSSFVTIGALTRTWTLTVDPLASYSVTYNNNGGGTAPSAQTKWYGEELALRGAITNRTNYVFKNWNTKADGTGASYAASAKYTGSAALTLYAQWYAPYTITPNANGGTLKSGCSALTKVYNTAKAIWASSLNPTRTGYTFTGWNTKADGTGTSYSAGANYTANANATLYAQWRINTWAVTYDGNGSTGGSTAAQTKTYGQSLALRSNGFTKTNYNFVNWNTAANGSGTSYDAGASYTGNAALNLYAQWKIAHGNPTIGSITVKRCTSDGTETAEGDRMKVDATWSVDNTTEGFTDTVGSTFKVTLNGTTDTVNLSGTSGTVSFVHSATALITSSYKVASVLEDSKGYTTSRTSTLSVAYFTMHFKAGGKGVGIGSPATTNNQLDVGMPTRLIAGSDNYSALRFKSLNRSGDAIRFYGATDEYGDEIVVGGGGRTIIGAGESALSLHNEFEAGTEGSENMYVTSDTHLYLYSHANTIGNKTQMLLYNAASPQLYGRCAADNTVTINNSSNNGVSSTGNTNIGLLQFQDKNGLWAGSFGVEAAGNAGKIRSYLGVHNKKTDGTEVSSWFCLDLNKDGSTTYSIPSPANFCSAIGALPKVPESANLPHNTATSNVFPVVLGNSFANNGQISYQNPGEFCTMLGLPHVNWTYIAGNASAAFYVRWCKHAGIVHVEVYGSKSMAQGTNVKLSSSAIASGSRPSKEVDGFIWGAVTAAGVLWVDTSGNVYGKTHSSGGVSYADGSLSYPVF